MSKNTVDKIKWTELATSLKESYKEDQIQYTKNLCNEAEKAEKSNNLRNVYQVINRLAGKSKTKHNTLNVKKRDGTGGGGASTAHFLIILRNRLMNGKNTSLTSTNILMTRQIST